METPNLHIIIVAEETPRSRYFRSLLKEEFDTGMQVEVYPFDKVFKPEVASKNTLFIIDLMDFDTSAHEAVERLKENYSSSKIIALHIYQSEELIRPLFKKGVDGYISSDPTRKEFFTAVKQVLNGDTYYPGSTA